MGVVTVRGRDGREKQITVDDNTEALVLSNQELIRILGEAMASFRRIK